MLMRFRYCLIMPAKPSKLVRLSTAFYVYQRSFITLLIIKISNIHIIINIRIHSGFPCKALPPCFSFISCLPYKNFFFSQLKIVWVIDNFTYVGCFELEDVQSSPMEPLY